MTDHENLQEALDHLGNVLDRDEDECRFGPIADYCWAHGWTGAYGSDYRASGCPYGQAVKFYKAATAPGRAELLYCEECAKLSPIGLRGPRPYHLSRCSHRTAPGRAEKEQK